MRMDPFRKPIVHAFRKPILRESGVIELLSNGHDTQTGIFTKDPGWEYEWMTTAEAVRILRGLVSTFPLDERGRAAFVLLLLSQYAYHLMPTGRRMHWVISADEPGLGKTSLVRMALSASGVPEKCSSGNDAAGLRYRVDEAVIMDRKYVVLEDLDLGPVKGRKGKKAALGKLITKEGWSVREFQIEKPIESSMPDLIITGRNLDWDLPGDLLARCVLIHLRTEIPKRVTVPIERESAEQQRVASALWTLVRNWALAERPHKGKSRFGFEQWCAIYGGIVEHAGMLDLFCPGPHQCHCGAHEGGHEIGTYPCQRVMTNPPVLIQGHRDAYDSRWYVDGGDCTGYMLRFQRGYSEHVCDCWSRINSPYSVEDEEEGGV